MRAIEDACAGSRHLEILRVDHEAELALVRVTDEGGTYSRTRWSLLKEVLTGAKQEDGAAKAKAEAKEGMKCSYQSEKPGKASTKHRCALNGAIDPSDGLHTANDAPGSQGQGPTVEERRSNQCSMADSLQQGSLPGSLALQELPIADFELGEAILLNAIQAGDSDAVAEPESFALPYPAPGGDKSGPSPVHLGKNPLKKCFNDAELALDAGVAGNDILEVGRAQGGSHGTSQGKGTVASHALERTTLVEHSSWPPKHVCGVSKATENEITLMREAEVVNVRALNAIEVPGEWRKVETTLDDDLVDTPTRFQIVSSSTIEKAVNSNSGKENGSEVLRRLMPSPPPPLVTLEKGSKRACMVTAPLPPSRLPEPPPSAFPHFDAHAEVVEPAGGDMDGVEIRASSACRRSVSSGNNEGSNQEAGQNSAGLGVFCSRAVKTGEVVFKEDALMHVCRSQVAPEMWRTIKRVMQEVDRGVRMKKIESLPPMSRSKLRKELEGRGLSPPWMGSEVSEMDLLQAIIFDRADSAVQRRVLDLYAPEEGSFPAARRLAWSAALDALRRIGALGPNAGNERGEAAAVPDGHEEDEQCSSLVRVLRICEANIFGQHDGEDLTTSALPYVLPLLPTLSYLWAVDPEEVEHGPRSLFCLACRINHSCLPNCSFLVEEGTMTVRAMTDLEPGTELFISYLTFDDVLKPTQHRRDVLRAIKYFDCHCYRCSTTHDFTRGIRCPRCYKGTVYPPCQYLQRGHSKCVDRKSAAGSEAGDASDAVGASACTACGRVPTRNWLSSAVSVEKKVSLKVNMCLEEFAKLYDEIQTAPSEERRLLEKALIQCSANEVIPCHGSQGGVVTSMITHGDPFHRELRERSVRRVVRSRSPVLGKAMARLYAQALYLLGDHHSMCLLHDHLAGFLMMEGRMEEAAYHSHERLVILLNIMGRPSISIINEFERLAYCLSTVAGFQKSNQEVPKGYWLPPLAGRCGTYAGLVQISPHVHRTVGHDEKGKQNNSIGGGTEMAAESGYCPVCGRCHGRPCDFFGSGQIDDTQGQRQGGMVKPLRVEPTSGIPNFANDQQVYLEGSRAALRDALRLSSVVHGHDSMYTIRARCRFQDVERRANGQRCPPLPLRPEQR